MRDAAVDGASGLADQFQAHRRHLRGVANRMLGSLADADDAVQECWLRLQRADPAGVADLRGWLTTVVGRICLDMLRAPGAPGGPRRHLAARTPGRVGGARRPGR